MRAPKPFAMLAVACALAALPGCSDSSCNNVETEIGAICIPEALLANQQAVIDVRESCGSICAQFPSCTGVVLAGAVYLTLREDQCSTSTSSCIATQCNHNIVSCALPALGVGDYPIVVSDGPGAILHVRQQGTSGCHLADVSDAGVDGGTDDDTGTDDGGVADGGIADGGN